MRRRLAIFGVIGLGLSKLAKAQLEFTQLQLKQVRLLFNPAQFDAVDVNGVTQINLKTVPTPPPVFEIIKILPDKPFAAIPLAKNYTYVLIFLNGLFQSPDFDYTRAGTTITFQDIVPGPGDIITYVGII